MTGGGRGGLLAEVTVRREAFELRASLEVAPGQILAVLGPNGSGKTTLLRALAGLLRLADGRLSVAGEVWDDPRARIFVPAVDRAAALVFQDYRLFPHLSVLDNVAFPQHARGRRRRAAREGAAAMLARVGLTELADRRPAQLSGGQAQRVALARALASEPRLLLLDEPLAALDARTKLEIRTQLRQYLTAFDGPSVVVTHDALEALVLADHLLVLEGGRVVQYGPAALVARRPATDYVARLVGLNLYAGAVTDLSRGRVELDGGGILYAAGHSADDAADGVVPFSGTTRMLAAVSPSAISLHTVQPDAGSPRNTWTGTVVSLELLTDRVRVAVEGRPDAIVDVTPAAVAELGLHCGQEVWLTAKATEVTAYPDPQLSPARSGPA